MTTDSTCCERAFGTRRQASRVSSNRRRAPGSTVLPCSGLALVTMPRPRSSWPRRDGDVIVSVGTSGTVFASSDVLMPDSSGTVAGFADATGRYLPLVCTLNAARVLDGIATDPGRRSTRPSPTWHCPDRRVPTEWFSSPTSKESGPRICPTRPASCTDSASRPRVPAHLARAAVEGPAVWPGGRA